MFIDTNSVCLIVGGGESIILLKFMDHLQQFTDRNFYRLAHQLQNVAVQT